MSSHSTSSITFSVLPKYKNDAEEPWVTQEGQLNMSVWLHPKTSMTLEDVAKLIEKFASSMVSEQLNQASAQNPTVMSMANINYQGTVHMMTFRGQNIRREQMINCSAKEYMRDGETFNMMFTQVMNTTVRPTKLWLLCCPCFLFCANRSDNSQSPQAQQTERDTQIPK